MVIKMSRKKFIILISSLIIIFGVVLTILLIKDPSKTDSQKFDEYGEEHKKYANTFDLKLIKEKNEQYYVITGLTTIGSSISDLIIPHTIDGIKVKKLLSNKDFSDYRFTEYVTIGSNIEYIGEENGNTFGNNAFINAINLKAIKVDINNNLYSSIDGVLYSKDKTILLKYPNNANLEDESIVNIRSGVTTIYENAFVNNQNIKSVVFNDSLTVIMDNAFKNCQNLSKLDFSKTIALNEIGAFAFYKCVNLTRVMLPNGLKKIGNNAFANCNTAKTMNFVELYIPDSVSDLGLHICYNTSNIDGFILSTTASNIENLKKNHAKFDISEDEVDKKIKIYK